MVGLSFYHEAPLDTQSPSAIAVMACSKPANTSKREAAMRTGISLGDRFRQLPPLVILAVGWLGMMLYANPGYLSYDSIHALADARNGNFHDLAAVIWRVVDFVIPGPFGMLAVQATCFLAGAYLLLCRCMSPRAAAVCASFVLWFPALSGTLAVIWTEAHAAGWLMLGTGLLCAARRGVRLVGLGALALGAAMTPGGAVLIGPLVVGLFTWGTASRRASRLAIAAAAWLATAAIAVALGGRFAAPAATERAQLDIAGTLHHGASSSDALLRPAFASPPPGELATAARSAYDPARPLADNRAAITRTFGAADPAATRRARDAIVSADRVAYLAYRWDVFRQLIQLAHPPTVSQVYVWFTDVQDLSGTAGLIKHNAAPSRLQRVLHPAMLWLGTTWLFEPYVYLLLAVALLPLCLRDREAGALLASGITGELALLFAGSDPLFRASLWLAVTAVLGVVILIARRARAATTQRITRTAE
jgi:hypothetical protein